MSDSDSTPHLVDEIAEEFARRQQNGENPSVEEYVHKNADFADEIRKRLASLVGKSDVKAALDPTLCSDVTTDRRDPVPQRLGDYQLEREIGRGGMGVVYEAYQQSLARRVALKVLPNRAFRSELMIQRFRREARAAGNLHHTNIVPVFGVGEEGGIHYYIMQLIDGVALDEVIGELRRIRADHNAPTYRLDSRTEANSISAATVAYSVYTGTTNRDGGSPKPCASTANVHVDDTYQGDTANLQSSAAINTMAHPASDTAMYWRSVAHIGAQVADALQYAHHHGILHRDIKPSNLLLDRDRTVWVTDFGLAKASDGDNLTETGDIVGTVRYMAPERFEGRCDARSDVYSLGLTLYELVAFRSAFDGRDRHELIRQVTNGHIRPLESIDRSIPNDLRTIVSTAIQPAPEDRYPTAGALAEDLKRFLDNRPIQARRIGAAERLWRWSKRNPMVASLIGAIGAILVVVAIMATWSSQHFRRQATEMEKLRDEAFAANQTAGELLFQSSQEEAGATRWIRVAGQRMEALSAVKRAVDVLPIMQFTPAEEYAARLRLRNDAIASLTQVDLRPNHLVRAVSPLLNTVQYDWHYSRYAQLDEQGNVLLRDAASDEKLFTLKGPGYRSSNGIMKFSPNGSFLAVVYFDITLRESQSVRVWNLQTRELLFDESDTPHYAPVAFNADNDLVAIGQHQQINVYDLNSKERVHQLPIGAPHSIEFHPLRNELFTTTLGYSVVKWDMSASPPNRVDYRVASPIYWLTWNHTSELLAGAGSDGQIYLWRGDSISPWADVIDAHQAEVVRLAFSNTGDRLVSEGWDGTVRVWDVGTKSQLLRLSNVHLRCSSFSPDDRMIALSDRKGQYGTWEWLEASSLRAWKVNNQPHHDRAAAFVQWRPETIASSTDQGFDFWDTTGQTKVASVAGAYPQMLVTTNRDAIITGGYTGTRRWPIEADDTRPGHITVGPSELISELRTKRVSTDWNQRHLGFPLYAGSFEEGRVIDLQHPTQVFQVKHYRIWKVAVSPDAAGKWVVTTTWHGRGVKVWDRASGELVKDLLPDADSATPVFSPDGSRLAISTEKEQSIWEVGTWKLLHRIERASHDDMPGELVYSHDGRYLFAQAARDTIRVINAATGEILAMLPSSPPGTITSLDCNPDGSRLVAIVDQNMQLWDLRELRKELKSIDLDWPTPPYALSRVHGDTAAPTVTVVEGDLVANQLDATESGRTTDQSSTPVERVDGPTPSLVSIDLEDVPLSQAVPRLKKELPNNDLTFAANAKKTISLSRLNEKRISLKLDSEPMWFALDKFCARADLAYLVSPYDWERFHAIALIPLLDPHERRFMVTTETSRFSLSNISYSRQRMINRYGSIQTSNGIELFLHVAVDPGIRLHRYGNTTCKFIYNDSPPTENRQNEAIHYRSGDVQYGTVVVVRTPWEGSQVPEAFTSIKGTQQLQVYIDPKEIITLEDLLSAEGKSFNTDTNETVTVLRISESTNTFTIRFRVNVNSADEQNTQSEAILVELQDEDGNIFPRRSWRTAGQWRDQSTTFLQSPTLGQPTKLVFYKCGTTNVEIPFEFRDVPIP